MTVYASEMTKHKDTVCIFLMVCDKLQSPWKTNTYTLSIKHIGNIYLSV